MKPHKRHAVIIAFAIVASFPGAASARHDLEVYARGNGQSGWAAVMFYTNGSGEDPTGNPDDAVDHGETYSQLALQITVRAENTVGQRLMTHGLLLNPDGTVHESRGRFYAYSTYRTSVDVREEGTGTDESVDLGALYEHEELDGWWEARSTLYFYPEEEGVFIALMYVAAREPIAKWRWELLGRPSSDMTVLGTESEEGGTYLFEGGDFRGGSAVAVRTPAYSPSARVNNHVDIDVKNALYAIYQGSSQQQTSITGSDGSSSECPCYYDPLLPAGITRFHLDGVATNDVAYPVLLAADVRLPSCAPEDPTDTQYCPTAG